MCYHSLEPQDSQLKKIRRLNAVIICEFYGYKCKNQQKSKWTSKNQTFRKSDHET